MFKWFKKWYDSKIEYVMYDYRYVDAVFTPVINRGGRSGSGMVDPENFGTISRERLSWKFRTPDRYAVVSEQWYIERTLYKKGLFFEIPIRTGRYDLASFEVDKMCIFGEYPENWNEYWKALGLEPNTADKLNELHKTEVALA